MAFSLPAPKLLDMGSQKCHNCSVKRLQRLSDTPPRPNEGIWFPTPEPKALRFLRKAATMDLDGRRVFTVRETAAQLGVGSQFVYRAIRRGHIPSVRIGGRVLVPIGAFDKLLACADGESRPDA